MVFVEEGTQGACETPWGRDGIGKIHVPGVTLTLAPLTNVNSFSRESSDVH